MLRHMATESDEEGEDYRTSVVMPKSLQKAVAHYCIDHELTFTDAVIEALTEYLAKHNRTSTK
jgi:hypothetical protein